MHIMFHNVAVKINADNRVSLSKNNQFFKTLNKGIVQFIKN